MSENIVMSKIAHLCTVLCAILTHFCAQFLCVNQIETNRCENRAFHVKIMRDFCI